MYEGRMCVRPTLLDPDTRSKPGEGIFIALFVRTLTYAYVHSLSTLYVERGADFYHGRRPMLLL